MTPETEEPETYNVSVPAFAEIATFGESLQEARFMAQDALELVILSKLEEGEMLPKDKKPVKLAKNAKMEEIIITISHRVEATPASYVKHTFAQSA